MNERTNAQTNLQTQDINGANKNFKANLSRKNPKISKKKDEKESKHVAEEKATTTTTSMSMSITVEAIKLP